MAASTAWRVDACPEDGFIQSDRQESGSASRLTQKDNSPFIELAVDFGRDE